MLRVLNALNYFDWKFKKNYPTYQPDERWQYRIGEVVKAPDNQKIEHVVDAGKIFPGYQLMHNGLKIRLGSYYDFGNTALLEQNKGVHEPQEEYVFQEVLKAVRPGAAMLELGSYWAFYAMWFHAEVARARCYMVEPDPYKMNFGKLNFAFNGMQGTFIEGFIGAEKGQLSGVPVLSVDEIMQGQGLDHLAILHADIQGYEYEMLLGAEATLQAGKADYVFISTHSNELHERCLEKLQEYDYRVFADADLDETYSWDGLIVARSALAAPVDAQISRK